MVVDPCMVVLNMTTLLKHSEAKVLIFRVEFLELSHLTLDLSQAEKKITVVFRQQFPIGILNFGSLCVQDLMNSFDLWQCVK